MAEISRERYAALYGPTAGDRIRLADTDLFIQIEHDHCAGGDEAVFGGGKVIRESMGMAHATRALDPFAKHHVAAALAVHRPALGEVREPAAEALRRRERTRMQLRIAAGQPARVALFRRSLVGERGKR